MNLYRFINVAEKDNIWGQLHTLRFVDIKNQKLLTTDQGGRMSAEVFEQVAKQASEVPYSMYLACIATLTGIGVIIINSIFGGPKDPPGK